MLIHLPRGAEAGSRAPAPAAPRLAAASAPSPPRQPRPLRTAAGPDRTGRAPAGRAATASAHRPCDPRLSRTLAELSARTSPRRRGATGTCRPQRPAGGGRQPPPGSADSPPQPGSATAGYGRRSLAGPRRGGLRRAERWLCRRASSEAPPGPVLGTVSEFPSPVPPSRRPGALPSPPLSAHGGRGCRGRDRPGALTHPHFPGRRGIREGRGGSASGPAADSFARPRRSCRPPGAAGPAPLRSRRPWRQGPARRPVGWARAWPVQTAPSQLRGGRASARRWAWVCGAGARARAGLGRAAPLPQLAAPQRSRGLPQAERGPPCRPGSSPVVFSPARVGRFCFGVSFSQKSIPRWPACALLTPPAPRGLPKAPRRGDLPAARGETSPARRSTACSLSAGISRPGEAPPARHRAARGDGRAPQGSRPRGRRLPGGWGRDSPG